MMANQKNSVGKVFLVGAGPGAPELITLRGIECLQRADVVLYDYLANPAILQHANPAAELICLGHHGHTRIWPQTEINAHMVQTAQQGQTVVRLKGGDPTIFARGAEELSELARHGIPYEIVPGITAALAAGSYAEVPLTHRDHASAVAFITGQEHGAKADSALDYGSLANFPGTLVFYMGVTTAERWSQALIRAGKPPETPALIIRRCSHSDQHTIRCTLSEISERLTTPKQLRPPAVVVVGPVADAAPQPNWFESRPLYGQKVLVTRPLHQASTLARAFEELGAAVVCQPAIEIGPPADFAALDQALAGLASIDWVVFSSVNGVQAMLDRLPILGLDLRCLGSVKLAAIGPATAGCLREHRLEPDCQPERFQAEDLAAALETDARGKRFLLIRASRGREVLGERLMAAGGHVTQVVAYQSSDVREPFPEIATQMAAGQIHWVTVTSSAIARSLASLFPNDLANAKLASISPVTTTTLKELGLRAAVEATEATMPSLVNAIVRDQSC
jgi:uroporphyrinogen III methyltransferase/synthase